MLAIVKTSSLPKAYPSQGLLQRIDLFGRRSNLACHARHRTESYNSGHSRSHNLSTCCKRTKEISMEAAKRRIY